MDRQLHAIQSTINTGDDCSVMGKAPLEELLRAAVIADRRRQAAGRALPALTLAMIRAAPPTIACERASLGD
ncbi:hypothetical protein LL972_10145 [Xanthomonas campestris pv. asclepiadis]|uniref:hypothetical protein n=1 Tax=Xanthomonas campestris TaxID=339 RepID=UPI001E61A60C|nr:hypothetical protein [Xanthomonas campestris]MCC4616360.1 hypothetical protein [Xanthomonas campestris pv. asclepiadis]